MDYGTHQNAEEQFRRGLSIRSTGYKNGTLMVTSDDCKFRYEYRSTYDWQVDVVFVCALPFDVASRSHAKQLEACKALTSLMGYETFSVIYLFNSPYYDDDDPAFIDSEIGPARDTWNKYVIECGTVVVAMWGSIGPLYDAGAITMEIIEVSVLCMDCLPVKYPPSEFEYIPTTRIKEYEGSDLL